MTMGCEFKTRTTARTSDIDRLLATKFGLFVCIDLSATEDELGNVTVAVEEVLLFKNCIRELAYRAQILHSSACSGLEEWIYVVASLDSVIRIVQIGINDLSRSKYMESLTWVKTTYFDWCYSNENDSEIPIPDFGANYMFAVDKHGLDTTFQLWCELSRRIKERGRPLPHGRFILPTLVAFWNRIKGGIDVFSRHLKNVKSNHACLSPYAACWIRLIMAMVYNSHQMHQILQSYDHIMDQEKCLNFSSVTKRKSKVGSFADFCQIAANTMDLKRNASSDEEDEEENARSNEPSPTGKYCKREAFYTRKNIISIRMNQRLPHLKLMLSKRLTCVYCCSQKHETEADIHSNRTGHKTKYECSTCKVPLCYGPRFDGESCAKLFHELEKINDPCAIGTITSVRAVKYRPPPPSRKRSGDDLPNLRSKSTEYDTPMTRRSGRYS